MNNEINRSLKIDPSKDMQSFVDVRIKLHCCRYWKLKEWEFNDMAFPFWRLYYNSIDGAKIYFNNNITSLSANQIIIIPPNTAFSTSLLTGNLKNKNESIIGRRIENLNEFDLLKARKMIDHFFIHFNLGIHYDNLIPGVYSFPIDDRLGKLISEIKSEIITNYKFLNFATTIKISSLIFLLIASIPEENWNIKKVDKRVNLAINFIETHISEKLPNTLLATNANMAVNSFHRLFKENTGLPLQEYILRRRIEKASVSLHHSTDSIDDIATKYGFCDRYHFSKTFKKIMKISPACYKQKLAMI